MKRPIFLYALFFLTVNSHLKAQTYNFEIGHRLGLKHIEQPGLSNTDDAVDNNINNDLYLRARYKKWAIELDGGYYQVIDYYSWPYTLQSRPVYADSIASNSYHSNVFSLCLIIQHRLFQTRNKKFTGYIGVNVANWWTHNLDNLSVYSISNGNVMDSVIKTDINDIFVGGNLSVTYQLDPRLSIGLMYRIQTDASTFDPGLISYEYLFNVGYCFGIGKEHLKH